MTSYIQRPVRVQAFQLLDSPESMNSLDVFFQNYSNISTCRVGNGIYFMNNGEPGLFDRMSLFIPFGQFIVKLPNKDGFTVMSESNFRQLYDIYDTVRECAANTNTQSFGASSSKGYSEGGIW